MLKFLPPLPFIELIASLMVLMGGALLIRLMSPKQEDLRQDGNAQLMIRLTILSILAILALLVFTFIWRIG